jgi:hypothetical protein
MTEDLTLVPVSFPGLPVVEGDVIEGNAGTVG